MKHDKIFQTVTANGMREMTLERFNEAIGMLWTSPCICPPDEKTGETLCCNHCGRPTARTSEELPGDDNIDDSWSKMFNIKTSVGFVNGAKWMRSIASPLLASRDARIRELEEENKKLNKANEFLENCRSQWAEMAIKLKATTQPKIQMLTACGMFEINPMFTSATLCKNCGKEKALHVTPPKN